MAVLVGGLADKVSSVFAAVGIGRRLMGAGRGLCGSMAKVDDVELYGTYLGSIYRACFAVVPVGSRGGDLSKSLRHSWEWPFCPCAACDRDTFGLPMMGEDV